MFNNLPLEKYKEVLISSLNGLDIDTKVDKTYYINKINTCNTKEQCLDLYNEYKATELIDRDNLLSDLKKTENIYERSTPTKKKTLFDLLFNRGVILCRQLQLKK